MINIDLICVGQLKSGIFKSVEKNILKKVKSNYSIRIIEVEDEKNKNIDRILEIEKIKKIEGEKILSKIKKGSYVITLEIEAKKSKFKNIADVVNLSNRETVSIIIGGSVGMSKKISDISDKKISISNMTLPHQLVRLIVLEQFTL